MPLVDHIITTFKQNLATSNSKGLVLDIDETLSWTIGYWIEQMQKKFGNPENLSIREMAIKYRYTQNVPYWQTPDALNWMEQARENDKMQESMTLIADANHYVQEISSIIPLVGYLTTRPRTVIEGTRKWLARHNFPKLDVLARPAEVTSEDGDKWKAATLDFLYPQVVGIIDDKLAVANSLPESYQGTFFLYGSSSCKPTLRKIIPCQSWPDVYAQIKTTYGQNS